MDKIFSSTRKRRTPSNPEGPSTLKKEPSFSGAIGEGSLSQKRQAVKEAFSDDKGKGKSQAGRGVGDKAPSLNVDIRNSLILPGLSQRFSVLLPSLSTAPESSVRSLLASQRARPDGPSLTVEEEELLFAEIRDVSTSSWNDDSSTLKRDWSSRSLSSVRGGKHIPGSLSTSTSSPSVLSTSDSEGGTISAPVGSSAFWAPSPPPTSTSFSSFNTFGVADSNGVKIKSYGFSGGSSLRDGEYIRKVKRSGNGVTLDPSFSNRKIGSSQGEGSHTPTKEEEIIPPPSIDVVGEPDSPTLSERTATPTSILRPTFTPFPLPTNGQANSNDKLSSSFSTPPSHSPPTPDSAEFRLRTEGQGRPQKKRQSLLSGLTPAQVKRISLALGEVESKLLRSGAERSDGLERSPEVVEEDETEVLQPPEEELTSRPTTRASESRSDVSSYYAGTSITPVKDTPSNHAADVETITKVEPPSPSRLPPSPRSHNLRAQVEVPRAKHTRQPSQPIPEASRPDVPRPILTPSRTQPVRHKPSSSVSGQPSPPIYIPGQPRPVGSMHRSDGSVSSRSGTPTQQPTSISPAIKGTGTMVTNRSRSDSNPSPIRQVIAPRTSSLARSLSATQGSGHAPNDISTTVPPLRFRNNHTQLIEADQERSQPSPFGNASTEAIEEEDEPREETDGSMGTKSVVHGNGHIGLADRQDSQAVFQQESLEGSTDSIGLNQYLRSPPATLRKMESSNTIASDFTENGLDVKWDNILSSSTSEVSNTPADEPSAALMLRKLSGMGSEELSCLQTKLVEKAKLERQALRGTSEFSPPIPLSPTFASTNLPSRSPKLGQEVVFAAQPFAVLPANPHSPPTHQERFASVPQTAVDPAYNPSAVLPGGAFPRRAAPPPPQQETTTVPKDTPSEMTEQVILTPPSTELSRKSSRRVAPEDDPDVRRDFEARIAAATAALNRTPSISAHPLRRKNTKKGAPIAISSPTLLSSSAKLTGTPVTTPEAIDPGMAKALEKASGSGSKMSMKWRKLGFRRGPSLSNNNEIHSPSTKPHTPKLEEPIALRAASPQPIQSAPLQSTTNREKSSPDLNAFRFPHNATGGSGSIGRSQSAKAETSSGGSIGRSQSAKAETSTGLRQMMGRMRSGKIDEKDSVERAQESAEPDPRRDVTSLQPPTTSSNKDTVAKFIEAGRALGLNDDQLGEMIVAKSTPDLSQIQSQTQSSAIATAYQANEHRSQPASDGRPAPSPAPTNVARRPSADKKPSGGAMGLLRSLSRGKKSRPSISEEGEEAVPRNVIVRRTILVPTEATTPKGSPQPPFASASGGDSPGSQKGRSGPGSRKLSVKRKPLNLTREDHALVQSSPPPQHARKISVATTSSARSEGQTENAGLGFLHPPILGQSTSTIGDGDGDASSMQRSSGGGSLYDLYNDSASNTGAQEMLVSPTKGERRINDEIPRAARRSTQAVEITEYADGQMVWSLVDALRGEDDEEDEESQDAYPHSRTASYDSVRRESGVDVFGGDTHGHTAWGRGSLSGATSGLNFRHRDRNADKVRPPTNVYFTSSADVADLIDHLSHDLDASRGRIDILPTITSSGNSPTDPRDGTAHSMVSGQFEDAPSPRKGPPAPIRLPQHLEGRELFPGHPQHTRGGLGSLRSEASPSAASFASSGSGLPGRTVEDRLQALLDRLKDSGAAAAS